MRLWELVRKEPDWAVSRIRVSEKAEADLAASQAREVGLREAAQRYRALSRSEGPRELVFEAGRALDAALSLPAPDLGETP